MKKKKNIRKLRHVEFLKVFHLASFYFRNLFTSPKVKYQKGKIEKQIEKNRHVHLVFEVKKKIKKTKIKSELKLKKKKSARSGKWNFKKFSI